MTATTTERPQTRAAAADHLLPQEVDHSCRNPLLFLFTASVLWLIFSLVAGILASIKMHAPGMMADTAALTYGRIAAVASSAFYYGFASQAAIAVALWLCARLARAYLVLPRCGVVAGIIWNLGVALGVLGIFAGGLTQHPVYQMPAWTSMVFIVAFAIFGVSAILTLNSRTERELYPSAWFILAATFVFPWIASVAYLLLGRYTVRGVVEPPIALWYANNFVWLWLGSIALAVIFYFVSKLSHKPLYSRGLAVFGFWSYLVFANALGFQNSPGLPAGYPALSAMMWVLLLLPAGAFAVNWHRTWSGHNRGGKEEEPAARYIWFSAMAFFAAVLLGFLVARPTVDEVVGLTVFQHGTAAWVNFGFISMALLGAMIFILPRLTEVDWPNAKMARLHYPLTVAGLVVVTAAWLIGGYVQGSAINTPAIPFNQTVKRLVPFIGINSMGLLLLLAAQAALLANMAMMFKECCARCCGRNGKEVAR